MPLVARVSVPWSALSRLDLVDPDTHNGQISFRSALDRAAFILGTDGWLITEVKQGAFVGADQAGNAILQMIVTAAASGSANGTSPAD
jgi:hypothetical protein